MYETKKVKIILKTIPKVPKIKKIKMKIKTDKKSTWYGVVKNCRSC